MAEKTEGERWQGSDAQQEQIREGVDLSVPTAIKGLNNVIGNHDRLREKVFTEVEIQALIIARDILMNQRNPQTDTSL